MYSMCVKSSVKQTGGEASPKKARHQGGNDNQEHGGTATVNSGATDTYVERNTSKKSATLVTELKRTSVPTQLATVKS